MQAVTFAGAGGNEVVRLEERADPEPVGEEIAVRVTHAGVNPADVQQRDGNYPPPLGAPEDVPGLEVAGEVAVCGSRALRWRPGDRVFGLVAGGGLADRVVVHERCVAPVPDALDDAAAAAVPEAFITAHDAVRIQAGLRMGETLLVHGANGGVGGAAAQIGLAAGARVLASSRSRGALQWLEEAGAALLDDAEFAEQVQRATDGCGADVILEVVGAAHFPANLDAVALRGRIVVVGVGGGTSTEISLLRLMQKRATVRGTVLRARSLEEKAQVVRDFEREVLPQLASGTVRPVIDRVFDADQVADAFDHLQEAGKNGKVLLRFGA